MSVNRVQKLLFSEYCDFEDMVLIESPFAQTTRDGKGIRQVHIGLTPSKLVLATDVLPPVDINKVTYIPGVDPDIETFELIAIYPVDCVNLSVYRRRKRQALKARFCNNRVLYFELGGFEKRKMFWNLWCEKVKFLSPEEGSSHSETSVATSTTGSTIYLLDKKIVLNNGLKQLWCRFGPNTAFRSSLMDNVHNGNTPTALIKKWTDRHLFLGKNFHEMPYDYRPLVMKPTVNQFIQEQTKRFLSPPKSAQKTQSALLKERNLNIGDYAQINRFGNNIREGCKTGLFLTVDDYMIPQRLSKMLYNSSSDALDIKNSPSFKYTSYYEDLAEASVRLWEMYKETDPNKFRLRHRRRYGISPRPHFLHGLGPWCVIPGSQYSAQVKRAASMVTIRKQPNEPELRLPISKRQLVSSISCELLNTENKTKTNTISGVPKSPVIFFWTPDYWYRPRSAKDAYLQLQMHLNNLKRYQRVLNSKTKGRKSKRNFLPWRLHSKSNKDKDTDEEFDDILPQRTRKRKSKFIYNNLLNNKFSDNTDVISNEPKRLPKETSLQYLKRILQLDVIVTAWDFNSNTLAEQLTMIDKELFLKISAVELEVILLKQNTKNAPNVSALVAFSHRISCLVSTEVLRDDSEKMRARLMARFINVADKCHKMSNFHSCKTVLSGLQSPAVYRLKKTWAYIRKRHATKYQVYEFLCRLYKDPRSPTYQKAFFVVIQNKPYLPYIGDIFAKLLDRIPEYTILKKSRKSETSLCSYHSSKTKSLVSVLDPAASIHNLNIFTKLFKVFTTVDHNSKDKINEPAKIIKLDREIKKQSSYTKFKGICDYYKPLNCYEDNRIKCLMEATEFMEKCQLGAINYCFNINELARSYLLKARYSEDRQNFYNSLSIEPPINNNGNKI